MRGQIDTAIGMILTLVIVAAVLALAVWGFFAITRMTSEAAYERVYETLESAGARYASSGSQRYERIPSPEPFCIFNASVHVDDRECTPGYSGHEICESADLRSYWGNMSEDDGNIVFRSGRSAQIDYIAPHNGAFACFRQGSQVVFFEGRGRYATVSPMREIGSIALREFPTGMGGACVDGNPSSARLVGYTSHPTTNIVEFMVLRGFDSTNDYCLNDARTIAFPGGTEYTIGPTNIELLVLDVDVLTGDIDDLRISGIPVDTSDIILG